MKLVLRYADPAGNVTAIVESPVAPKERVAVARYILSLGKAEQVGFAVAPRLGGQGRLEMMGGEFCGNAARSFGLLLARERYASGIHTVSLEISGAEAPLTVRANLDRQEAEAQMPLPLGLTEFCWEGRRFPQVELPGIRHILVEGPPEGFLVQRILTAQRPLSVEALGVLFLQKENMTPVVYVRSTDSLVWESSCGSGSTAWAWYLSQGAPDGEYAYLLHQPGGMIQVRVRRVGGAATGITMGGKVTLSQALSLEVPLN